MIIATGGIAQWLECSPCMRNVGGSNPPSSMLSFSRFFFCRYMLFRGPRPRCVYILSQARFFVSSMLSFSRFFFLGICSSGGHDLVAYISCLRLVFLFLPLFGILWPFVSLFAVMFLTFFRHYLFCRSLAKYGYVHLVTLVPKTGTF